jgi:aspartyl-tRNA synthetase
MFSKLFSKPTCFHNQECRTKTLEIEEDSLTLLNANNNTPMRIGDLFSKSWQKRGFKIKSKSMEMS